LRKIGLFEAKQKLSELVEQAQHGEKIGITRRGELAAVLVPPAPQIDLKEVFKDIEDIRKRAKGSVNVRDLIEEGRT
jgi:prevent-host-death family protein